MFDPEASQAILMVSNTGRAFYREFEVTGHYKVHRGTFNASWVRSQAGGSLNDFNQFFGNSGAALIESNQQGRLPFDAPSRILAWGEWDAPFRLTVLPQLDIHTGFPYSLVNQERQHIGQRNSQRFPRFASFDLQVTRPRSIPFRCFMLHYVSADWNESGLSDWRVLTRPVY